jgi:serine/threonine protein kinase
VSDGGDVRTIGPYRLIVKLGQGAMGEVWRALDTRLDRNVAIKLLPSALAADPERRARMLREAKAAAAVPHPNVVTLHDIGSDGGEDYLVMELVEGRTLAELLRERKPELREALELTIGVADALAAAHKQGILHRDVKAANVMVTRDGRVKVLDFGLARLRAAVSVPAVPSAASGKLSVHTLDATLPSQGGSLAETREGTMLGTPAYFSPEQVQGRLPDEKSEIFSLGVLAYELLAGRNPFEATNFDELCAKIVCCDPAPLDVPEPLRTVVLKSLAFEPAERHADMQTFAAALHHARDVLFAPKSRRRWPWILAAALVAALAATAVVLIATRRHAQSPADRYITQAIDEYDLFYNDKAIASLRAAMKVAPDDPRPYAYLVLMGYADDVETLRAASSAAERMAHAKKKRDRSLVDAAVTLVRDGPAAARTALGAPGRDRELQFWSAELAFKAGAWDDALAGYDALLAEKTPRFRGRIYDHDVAVLLWRDRVADAVPIGEAYAQAFPGEADAVGTQSTVYAAAGRLDEALDLANEAVSLNRSEDTLAGLAKVHALRGELSEAEKLYRGSIDAAPAYRRPLRRAALAIVLLMEDRATDARDAVSACLPGGEDANERTVSICLFVAGLTDDHLAETVIPLLMQRTRVPPPAVPYGRPAALAALLDAKRRHEDHLLSDEEAAGDLYVAYHLPFGSSLPSRIRAEGRIASGDARHAIPLLVSSRRADVPALLTLATAYAAAASPGKARETIDRLRTAWPHADHDTPMLTRAQALAASLPSE